MARISGTLGINSLVICVLLQRTGGLLNNERSEQRRYLISVIRPTAEFHIAVLIIKREPRDVYLACALEDARWHIQTTAVMFDHYICVVRAIESLISAVGVCSCVFRTKQNGGNGKRKEKSCKMQITLIKFAKGFFGWVTIFVHFLG